MMFRVYNPDKLTRLLAEELAYRQVMADFWYYVLDDVEMSSYTLDTLVSLNNVAKRLGIAEEVYHQALDIYDFSHSGRSDFVPDVDYIQEVKQNLEMYRDTEILF